MQSIVIGNWKMNPQTATLAATLAKDLKRGLACVHGPEVVVAPPTLYIDAVKKVLGTSTAIGLGAQNAHHEKLGAHTGEVSFLMLKGYGVQYVIVGHSERRDAGETNADVAKKIDAALKENLRPVLCVGERTRDTDGHYLSYIEDEVRVALTQVPKSKLARMVIAYEPIWAIGTGVNATSEDAHEVKLFIQKILTDMFGRSGANQVRILYGGSVNARNADELMRGGDVDGFLVGGSSLNADEFVKIVKTVESYVKH